MFIMNNEINHNKQRRWQLLQLVYKLSNGSTQTLVPYNILTEKLRWETERTRQTCDYLKAEGLLGVGSLGATSISHEGIKRIEDNMSGKQPETFPANIVVVNGGQIGNLSQGNNNTVHQGTDSTGTDLAQALRLQMAARGDLTKEVHHLLSLIKAESSDRIDIISALDVVCKQNTKWKQVFQDFSVQAVAGTASSLLLDAAKYLFPH
jgi:hypothetical protein